ncbi:MAG TPA: FAD-binding protein [Mycobacteriales bacterium]|nr:FAD-binding protein [Mycobacteriales bacterium]
MDVDWDASFDFVAVGSGGGGMVAALAAADASATALVIEKQSMVGGSTAMSGGMAWVPNNAVMRRAGVPDSYEEAMAYFDDVVGDVGPASSRERRHAFCTAGPEMIDFLEAQGVKFVYCPGYSDYYSDAKGGSDTGRGVEPVPWNGHQLGSWSGKVQIGMAKHLGMAVMTNEARYLSHYNRSLTAFATSARVAIRTMKAKALRQDLLTNGASFIGQALKIALERGVEIWTDAPLDDLIVEKGRVVGVRVVRDGKPVVVEARNGVLLSTGGFAQNREMRTAFSGDQPNTARWSMANPGDTGEAIRTAMALGAKTDFMDEAWWLPSPRSGKFGQNTLDQARQRPRTIYVDAAGQRFVNESNSYMEVGKAMYARDKTSKAVPCWLIFDDRYRKRYAHVRSSPGRFPKESFESGKIKKAATLRELAELCGIDPAGLVETVERFNRYAVDGKDPEYGRGASAYNKALGDPHRKVKNPCVEPIDEAPFYACDVVPGDVGTCGGLLTDEHARVIGADDKPIPGLYATGNATATVMGRHYLGPGGSIANSMIFGYIAAKHATSEAST